MHDQPEEGAQNAPFFPDRLIVALVRLCGALSSALILVVFLQIVVAVTRRYVFDRPLQWNDELIGYLLVTLVMLGAAEALRRGDHIAIDLLTARLGPRMARVQAALAHLSVLVFAGVVGISIWDSIAFARSFGSYSVGYIEIETWIPQVPVVLGMGLLALMSGLGLLRTLTGAPK